MKAEKTIYLNRDKTKVVREDSPDAAFLLVRAGSEISNAEAQRYGLLPKSAAASKDPPMPRNKMIATANALPGGSKPEEPPKDSPVAAEFSEEDALTLDLKRANAATLQAICGVLGLPVAETNREMTEAILAERARRATDK